MFFGLRVTAPLAYRLSHSAGHAVKEPLALHSLKFGAGNRFCLVLLAHKIQHARNGNKPAVLAGQPPQQIFNSWMHNSVIHETAGEMCVSDADPVLFFQPVLVCFAEQVAKRGTVMSVRAAEPHFHKRLLNSSSPASVSLRFEQVLLRLWSAISIPLRCKPSTKARYSGFWRLAPPTCAFATLASGHTDLVVRTPISLSKL